MAIFEVEANGQAFEIEAPDINAAMAAFKNYQPQQAPGLDSQQFNDRFRGEQPEQSMIPSAIADIPTEIRGAFFENLDAIKKGLMPSGQGGRGQLESLMDTGKGLAAIPGLAMAPITGAARSLIGRPLAAVEDYGREISGMPADPEGSYARGKSSADMAMMAGRPTGSPVKVGGAYQWQSAAPKAQLPGQEAALAADRLSQSGAPVQVPRAVTSDSMLTQRASATARNIPYAGDPLVKASERTLTQLGAKADEVASGFGGGTAQGSGTTAGGSIKDWITGESKANVSKLYDRVDNLVNQQTATPLVNTRGVVAEIQAERQAARLPNGKAVDDILPAVNDPAGLTYQGIKKLRSSVGESMSSGILPEGMSGADLKRLYSALTDDLRSSVLVGGGQRAVAEFDRANKYNKLVSNRRESLAKIVGANGDVPAERVFDRMLAMAGSSSRADQIKLLQARKVMGADEWNEFASGVVSRLGRDPQGNFSPQLFVRDYGKLSDAGKATLFRSGGKTDLATHLDDIATVSARHKELAKFANPSGTGQVLMGGGIGAGLLADPLTTAGLVIGGRGLAHALSRPASAASLAKYVKAQQALAMQPSSPAAFAAFNLASRNLISNLGEFGRGLSPENFIRGLQGGVPVSADDEQPEP